MRFRLKEVDIKGLQSKLDKANEAACWALTRNALADCSPYVPYKTGALKKSGREVLQGGTACIEWGGDAKTAQYARKQYYQTLNHNTPGNAAMSPKATDHWLEHARAARGSEWKKIYEAKLGAELARS